MPKLIYCEDAIRKPRNEKGHYLFWTDLEMIHLVLPPMMFFILHGRN